MLPWVSISEFLIRVVDIRLPSLAKIIGTEIIVTGELFFSSLNLLSNSPLLLVSSLTTSASTYPSMTAGPKSFSNFAISNSESGNFSLITDSNMETLF